MKMKLAIAGLVLLTVVNVSALLTIAYQHFRVERRVHPPDRPGLGMIGIERKLGLSPEQLTAIQTQHRQFMAEMEPVIAAVHKKEAALMDAIIADPADKTRIVGLIKEIGELEISIKTMTTLDMIRTKSLLTPGQKHKFAAFLREGMRHGRHQGPADPGPPGGPHLDPGSPDEPKPGPGLPGEPRPAPPAGGE